MLYCDFEKYYFKGNFTEVKHNGRIYIIDKERVEPIEKHEYLVNIWEVTDNKLKRLERFTTSSMHYGNDEWVINKFIKKRTT